MVATPIPKGSVVGESKDLHFNVGAGDKSKASTALNVPKDTQWGTSKTVVASPYAGGKEALITFVSDGDGIRANFDDGKPFSCRLVSIDAPEVAHAARVQNGKAIPASPDQAYGPEAKNYLAGLIENKRVNIVVTQSEENSKQGRNFCQVNFKGEDVNLKMVEAGFAHVYGKYIHPLLAERYNAAQIKAAKDRAGLWQQDDPLSPEIFRNLYR